MNHGSSHPAGFPPSGSPYNPDLNDIDEDMVLFNDEGLDEYDDQGFLGAGNSQHNTSNLNSSIGTQSQAGPAYTFSPVGSNPGFNSQPIMPPNGNQFLNQAANSPSYNHFYGQPSAQMGFNHSVGQAYQSSNAQQFSSQASTHPGNLNHSTGQASHHSMSQQFSSQASTHPGSFNHPIGQTSHHPGCNQFSGQSVQPNNNYMANQASLQPGSDLMVDHHSPQIIQGFNHNDYEHDSDYLEEDPAEDIDMPVNVY
ncbi:hypothetical protein B0T20DRAFT_495746 [Sordaria brevicollis]|uniref:Uncharacterized protein n=1 Tax=Sordaria brevicollis TaxID=83679 RepID=A0AAE0PGR8_SORBR|nr:hypothetical protein B0T20DRAFT_495746 [Sordaria brevicollis]